jgi:hypothetical protein
MPQESAARNRKRATNELGAGLRAARSRFPRRNFSRAPRGEAESAAPGIFTNNDRLI